MGLSNRVRFVAIVCIAVFAFTAITAIPALALFDAQTQVDHLFADLPSVIVRYAEDVALPDAPALGVLATRGPPLS